MEADESVVVFGEDVGAFGGVFRCTKGLQERFGEHRCFDTPINESAIVGAAIGMAAFGLRPCVEIQFADYMYPAYDQIVSEAARLRYRSAGQFSAPAHHPHADRRRDLRRPDPLAEPGGPVHSRVGADDGDPVESLRRQGAVVGRDLRQRPRHLPRAEASLPRAVRGRPRRPATDVGFPSAGRGARRVLRGAPRQGARRPARVPR